MLRQHAATPSALDTLIQKRRLAASAPVGDALGKAAGTTPKAPTLPKGMSGGKVAAIVAGVAVAGGALYMMTRKKEKPPEAVGPWTERVASERTAPQAGPAFNR